MGMQIAARHPSTQVHWPLAGLRPNPIRILGYSSTIALNACVLALLLIPLQIPLPITTDPAPTWIVQVRRPTPTPAVIVPKHEPAPRQPQPTANPQPRVAPTPVPAPVIVDSGNPVALAVTPEASASLTPALVSTAPAVAPVQLEYILATPPPYPRMALRRGITGTVLLRVLVGIDGKPITVEIAESSGHRRLDAAARRHVLAQWRFRPAIRAGAPTQAIGLVPIEFSLN